jgi:hypothetical protein
MDAEAQVDMDWAGTDVAESRSDGAAAGGTGTAGAREGSGGTAYLSDEEILGISPVDADSRTQRAVIPSGARNLSSIEDDGGNQPRRDSSGKSGPRNDSEVDADGNPQAEARATSGDGAAAMPAWMAAAAADPKNGGEARSLWAEHQEFRAAFGSATEARTFVQEARAVAEEARAIKELLPGGVKDIVSLREATQSVERIDAALFSGDARAQADVVAEMARVNPAAFRSMFAEAARVMAGLDARGTRQEAGGTRQDAGGREARNFDGSSENIRSGALSLRENGEAWGNQDQNFKSQISNLKLQNQNQNQNLNQDQNQNRRQDAGATNAANHPSQELRASQSPFAGTQGKPNFDPAAYAAFERATNDTVARDVRGSISDTLARVMPEGVAEGAARRIGEDIFGEVHRALAADRALSEQVASLLRGSGAAGGPASPNGGYDGFRFGVAEQARVAALVAGRAKQLVPSVARRVIGEWTSSVLNTARSKAARQAAAASRVDIAAPGGSSDSMPLRAMSAREVNYASMSDEQILGM